mgnify:CR=1 FL=1
MNKYLKYSAYLSIYVNLFGLLLFFAGLAVFFGHPLIYFVAAFILGLMGLFSDSRKYAIYGISISVVIFALMFAFTLFLGSGDTMMN